MYDNEENPKYNSGTCPSCKLVVTDLGPERAKDSGSLITPRFGISNYFGYSQDKSAFIHSDSWGTESAAYTRLSREVDNYCWNNQDFLPVISAGNLGVLVSEISTVSDPATAKNAIAVGASLNSKSQRPGGFGESFDIRMQGGTSVKTVEELFSPPLNFRALRGKYLRNSVMQARVYGSICVDHQ